MERRNSRPGFLPEPEMEMAAHVNDLLEKFELTPKQLVSITKLFRRDCQFGLRTQTNPQADIKMLPSYWGRFSRNYTFFHVFIFDSESNNSLDQISYPAQ